MVMDRHTRISLAYLDLKTVPIDVVRRLTVARELDLSNNFLSDLRFLEDCQYLGSLILDHNQLTSHVKIPYLPVLHTLWLNHNHIKNLPTFMNELNQSCPNLRYLSMMDNEAAPSYFNGGTLTQYMDYRMVSHIKFMSLLNLCCANLRYLSMMDNEAAPSYFNGGTLTQYMDYRQYVISQFPHLEMLDDRPVTQSDREEALRIYTRQNKALANSIKQKTRDKKRRASRQSTLSTLALPELPSVWDLPT